MKKLVAIPLTLVISVTPLLAQTTSTVNFNGVSTEVGSMVQDNTTYWGVREIGKVTGLSVEGIVANGRFYLPLRFVAEKFGMDLSYKNGIVLPLRRLIGLRSFLYLSL